MMMMTAATFWLISFISVIILSVVLTLKCCTVPKWASAMEVTWRNRHRLKYFFSIGFVAIKVLSKYWAAYSVRDLTFWLWHYAKCSTHNRNYSSTRKLRYHILTFHSVSYRNRRQPSISQLLLIYTLLWCFVFTPFHRRRHQRHHHSSWVRCFLFQHKIIQTFKWKYNSLFAISWWWS